MNYTHKVINHAGNACFRGTLTACVNYIKKTKGTKQYGIIKL